MDRRPARTRPTWSARRAWSLVVVAALMSVGLAITSQPAGANTFGKNGLLAFVGRGSNHALDIWTMDSNGNLKDVTARFPGAVHLQPTFSPECGPHVAYVTRAMPSSPGQIYWLPASPGPTSQEVKISHSSTMDDSYPSFTPGGGGLTYSEADWRDGKRVPDGRIMGSHLQGGPANALTLPNEGDNITPAWSPVTSWIAFASNRDDPTGKQYDLFVMMSQGEQGWTNNHWPASRITTQGGEEPQWAPDGRSIVYVNHGGIYVINEVTAGEPFPKLHILPTFGQPLQLTRSGNDSNPQWMPDQQGHDAGAIVFQRGDRTFVMNANGQDQRPYSGTPAFSQDPDVQPAATFFGQPGQNRINGTAGRDLVCWWDYGNHVVTLGGGDDLVFGGPGHDVLYGGPGNDLIQGGGGRCVAGDRIYGNSGNDFLTGSPCNDWIDGGTGEDRIVGESGDDVLWDQYPNGDGGADHDVLVGSLGTDTCYGDQNDLIMCAHVVLLPVLPQYDGFTTDLKSHG